MPHSPAPWSRTDKGKARPYIVAQCSETGRRGTVIAFGEPTGGTGWPDLKDEEVEANVRLVEEAPNLLKACKRAQALMGYLTSSEPKCTCDNDVGFVCEDCAVRRASAFIDQAIKNAEEESCSKS